MLKIENRVNTGVFARWCLKHTANIVVFITSGKNIVNAMLLGAKHFGMFGVFCSESLKKTWKQHLFDDFQWHTKM